MRAFFRRHRWVIRSAAIILFLSAAVQDALEPPPRDVSLELSCRPPSEREGRTTPFSSVCETGEKLFFGVKTSPKYRYFAAVSIDQAGAATWFFPAGEGDRSVDVEPERGRHWLARSVQIEADHARGEATVYGVFSAVPLSQDEIRQVFMAHAVVPRVVRVERKMLVIPCEEG